MPKATRKGKRTRKSIRNQTGLEEGSESGRRFRMLFALNAVTRFSIEWKQDSRNSGPALGGRRLIDAKRRVKSG
jgi:hypothetical protein